MTPTTLWVLPDATPPLRHVLVEYERTVGGSDVRYWETAPAGRQAFGRSLTLRRSSSGYDLSVKVISPRLGLALHRHPAEVVVVLEIDLAALYAVVSALLRPRRRIVALIESDLADMGVTGSARWKMWFRRIVARRINTFVANNSRATAYLTEGVGVPHDKIVEGWWLAGLPEEAPATAPAPEVLARGSGPVFISVGQLIERKGHGLLLQAAADYTEQVGPCRVWILGTGPDREQLEATAARLGLADSTTFFGHVDHAAMKGAAQAADVFVFPTLGDLVGRALVEMLSMGLPTVVSKHSGAIGTLIEAGSNAIVVDPTDRTDMVRALRAATDPTTVEAMAPAVARTAAKVSVPAAVAVIREGIRRSAQ